MRIFKFFGFSLLLLILLGALALSGFLFQLRPQHDGDIVLPDLDDSTTVYFDENGIPHIYGETASDAYFALGYIHASERLFQMDLLRRVGAGKLSAFFGESTLEVDRLFHTMGLPQYAQSSAENFPNLNPELQTIIHRYLQGVNYYAENEPTPLEYLIAGLPREAFTTTDIYHIAGYMAFSFAVGLKTDPLVEQLYHKVGGAYVAELALEHYTAQPLAPSGRKDSAATAIFSAEVISALNNLPAPLFSGSNTWIVSGNLTTSGKPVFANDTHIKYSQPSTWYEAHLEYPGTSLYGNFLAGIPLPLVGHTDHHAWGLTMFENDDTDFFFEEFHPDDTTKVRYRNEIWTDIETEKVIIRVKDGRDDTLLIRKTQHGSIINEFLDEPDHRPVSMFWTYTKKPNELPEAFYEFQSATNLSDFKRAIKRIHAPGLNISYADTNNNIALYSAAHLVHRPDHVNSKRVLDGGSGEDDPLGYYPFEANPQVENPASGMVFSANSQHDTTAYGVMHPGYYTAATRMERIRQKLSERNDWTVDKMKPMITDAYSKSDAELAQELFGIIRTSENDSLHTFFKPLETWDGQHEIEDTEPVMYYSLLYFLMAETFQDDMGRDLFVAYLQTHLMKRTNFKIFLSETSKWFDRSDTEVEENKQDVVLAAAIKSMHQLQETFGDQIPEWGAVHTLTFPHPLGQVKPLDKIFNTGPFPVAGANETINQQSFFYNDSSHYPVQHGPQMRILIDLAEIENSISINPTGQSGNVLSPHYNDQSEQFISGKFRPQLMNRREIERNSILLILSPE